MNTNWNNLSFPRICGLLAANPSKLSQAMHNAGFKHLGLDFAYTAIKTINTIESINALKELGFRGLSLTIPHKEKALEVVSNVEQSVKKIGSINTVINDGSELHGFNTDVYGIMQALSEASFDNSKPAIIIGAGGASRAGIYALQELGVKEISITNRTLSRAENLAKEFNINVLKLEELVQNLESKFIINSTPNESIFDYSLLNKSNEVFDMITKETEFIKAAKSKGIKAIEGKKMLLYQAVKQFELFTEKEAPIEVMEKALELHN